MSFRPRLHALAAAAVLVAISLTPRAIAQAHGLGMGDDFARLSPRESADLLANFRKYREPGVGRLRFVITHTERRSDEEPRYTGELITAWTETGPVSRIEIIREGAPAKDGRRFLIRGGKSPAIWTLDAAGKPVRADATALTPLVAGLVYTPYDLQYPFIHWPEARYRTTERFRTRPTHYFTLKPDGAFATAHPEIGEVNLGIDRAYSAPMRAETLDGKGKPMRELRAESFKKIKERWIPCTYELRDLRLRATDTLEIKSAALGLDLPASTFDPELLASPAPATPAAEFVKAD